MHNPPVQVASQPAHGLIKSSNGIYSVSVAAMPEMAPLLGANALQISLGTMDYEVAAARAPFIALELSFAMEDLFAEQEQSIGGDDKEVLHLGGRQQPLNRDAIIERLMGAAEIRAVTFEAPFPLEAPGTRRLMRFVDELVVDFGFQLPRYSPGYWRLCAKIQRWKDVGSSLGAAYPAELDPEPESNPRPPLEFSLYDLIVRFEDEMSAQWSSSRRRFYNQAFETLLKVLKPDRAVRSLTRQDFKRVRTVVEDLAPNWSKKKQLASLPIEEAAKRCRELGLPRPSLPHINHFVYVYHIMMEFAVAEGAAEKNPVKLLVRRVPVARIRGTRPFPIADLQQIFSCGPCFAKPLPLEKKTEFFWLPLISLWMGLRLSEGAQLETSDVEFIDGIPIFRIRPRPNDNPAIAQFVKTEAALRVVPIHPFLQQVGILEQWERARARGDKKLFGGVRRKGVSYTYNWISWRCNRWVREAIGSKKALTFRSFRHNFRDALRDAEVPTDRAGLLGGWTGTTAPERYGIGGSVPRLYQDIKSVSYPGLDLSHLLLPDQRALPSP